MTAKKKKIEWRNAFTYSERIFINAILFFMLCDLLSGCCQCCLNPNDDNEYGLVRVGQGSYELVKIVRSQPNKVVVTIASQPSAQKEQKNELCTDILNTTTDMGVPNPKVADTIVLQFSQYECSI